MKIVPWDNPFPVLTGGRKNLVEWHGIATLLSLNSLSQL